MTLDQFLTKYLGQTKGYPTDSSYRGECLSIVKLYIKECFGISPPASGTNSAYGYWSNFPHPLGTVFKKVPNTPELVPKKGWIVVWKPWDTNEYGHIAIVDKGCTKTVLKNIAQNWTSKVFQRESQNYNNVKGYLVPTTQNDMTDIVKKYGCKTIEELDSKIFEHVGLDWGNENNLENKSYLASDRRKNRRLEEELEQLKTDHKKELADQKTVCQKQVDVITETLNGQIKSLSIQAEDILQENKRLIDQLKTANESIGELQRKLLENTTPILQPEVKLTWSYIFEIIKQKLLKE